MPQESSRPLTGNCVSEARGADTGPAISLIRREAKFLALKMQAVPLPAIKPLEDRCAVLKISHYLLTQKCRFQAQKKYPEAQTSSLYTIAYHPVFLLLKVPKRPLQRDPSVCRRAFQESQATRFSLL